MSKAPPLESLRKRLDKIDAQLHALLVARAMTSLEVAAAKRADLAAGGLALRPAREADLLRRLIDLPAGPLPAPAIHQVWREIIGTSAWLQAPFAIATTPQTASFASGLYGSMVPVVTLKTVPLVLRSLATGTAQIAVLPDFTTDPWWPRLFEPRFARLKIAGHLPFLRRPARSSAVLVGALTLQPSRADQSYLGLICAAPIRQAELARRLRQAGLAGRGIAVASNRRGFAQLVEIDGFLTLDDRRLAEFLSALDKICTASALLGICPVPLVDPTSKGASS